MERFGRYAFSLMFIGLGILILAWFRLFQSGDDRWLIGLGFIGGGIALMIMFLIMGSLAKGKARLFAEATPGTGAITAVEKSMRAHGEEHDAGFWLTMTVEVPGRAPFTARVHGFVLSRRGQAAPAWPRHSCSGASVEPAEAPHWHGQPSSPAALAAYRGDGRADGIVVASCRTTA